MNDHESPTVACQEDQPTGCGGHGEAMTMARRELIAASEFLQALWNSATGYGELWCQHQYRTIRQKWVPLPASPATILAGVEWAYRGSQAGWTIFHGVNPRITTGGGNVNVENVVALVADVDAGKPAFGTLDERLARLAAVGCSPSAIICSGGGRHLYWLLERQVRYVDLPADLSRMIRDFLGSDATVDRQRRMRLPGTLNLKIGGQPRACTVLTPPPFQRHSAEALFTGLVALGVAPVQLDDGSRRVRGGHGPAGTSTPEVESRDGGAARDARPVVRRDPPQPGDRPPLPPGLWGHERLLIETGDFGADGHDSRSEGDQAACYALVRCGLSDSQIVAVFESYPIGEKYRELRGDGAGYLVRSIRTAREFEREKFPRQNVRAVLKKCRRNRLDGKTWAVEFDLRPLEGPSAGRAIVERVGLDGSDPRLAELATALASVAGISIADPTKPGVPWNRLDGAEVCAVLVRRQGPRVGTRPGIWTSVEAISDSRAPDSTSPGGEREGREAARCPSVTT